MKIVAEAEGTYFASYIDRTFSKEENEEITKIIDELSLPRKT